MPYRASRQNAYVHPFADEPHPLKVFGTLVDADKLVLCYNPFLRFLIQKQETYLVLLHVRSLFLFTLTVLMATSIAFSQATPDKKDEATPTPTPPPPLVTRDPTKPVTAEQVVESAIVFYGFPAGRPTLNQIRKTTLERGKMTAANAEGKLDVGTYHRWIIRGESLDKEKVRIDYDTPGSRFSLVYNEGNIFGIFNNTVFTPRADLATSFENSMYRGLEGMLRYKENESTIELAGKEKVYGVEFYFVDVTDKKQRKTRYYVSVKSFRVMMLTYEEGGVSYKRRFYNYNYAQGTLVPYRTTLTANEKLVEETEIGTVTFGQKVDEELFKQTR